MRDDYSATVLAHLDCGAHGIIDLCRVCPDTVEAREPVTLPECDAVLVVSVDRAESRTAVNVRGG